MMTRQDQGMPFLLQYENVAWYEDGIVRILDRRRYPMEEVFVSCENHKEVARAISDMVTQSGGPAMAAAMGMALAAYESRNLKDPYSYLENAAKTLSTARPTTKASMRRVVEQSLEAAQSALDRGENIVRAVFDDALRQTEERYARIGKAAEHLVDLFPSKGTVMTQCFAEVIVGKMVLECQKRKKEICFLCPETRPYFQGARLTASVISDLGGEVFVICDNMPGYILKKEHVDLFTSAADVITLDGHVVNKVGTFQIALAAHYYNIPYYVSGTPNKAHPSIDSVTIEYRDDSSVINVFGTKTTKPNVRALYPAFDITPPELVTGIVSENGLITPGKPEV